MKSEKPVYHAEIKLKESEILDILAWYFGVNPADVKFNVIKMQMDGEIVEAVVRKEVRVPTFPTRNGIDEKVRIPTLDIEETLQSHYCPSNK